MARPYKTLLVDTVDQVHTITLNRPERRNAIGPEMVNELRWALEDAELDAAIRVIVLTGAGKTFCAGGDFGQMTSGSDQASIAEHPKGGGDYGALLLAMFGLSKPLIAKVNGHAMGGGLGLVACCHFALGHEQVQLGTPEVDVGLFPMMIMAILSRLIPRRRLISMMLLGERLNAKEAAELGLMQLAGGVDELDGAVALLAKRLVNKAPLAIQQGLQALAAQDGVPLAEALPMLRDRLFVLLGTEDAREGLMAFMQKRTPVWTGK